MLIPTFPAALPDVAETARAIAAELAPAAESDDAHGAFPHANLARLRAAGLLGLTAPERFGGQGQGLAAAAEVVEVIAGADPSSALIVVMHYLNLATLPKGRWNAAVLARVLTRAARGDLINALRVEPDLGTPLRGGLPATIARRTLSGWSLSGRKTYCTGCEGLTWGLVWARTDEHTPRVGQFLVPLSAAGVRIERTWDTLGLRASGSHDVVFDDVALAPADAVDIRPPAEWSARADEVAVWGGVLIGALYTGIAAAALDWTAGFLRDRVPSNLGKPLAQLPRQQEAAGSIAGLIAVNRRLVRSAARDTDAGQPPSATEAGLIKFATTENAIAAVERALKLTGNHGIARRNPLERHLRDVLCGRIHSPQEDTVHVGAGRAVLDL